MNLFIKIFLLSSAYTFPCLVYAEDSKGGMPQLDPSSYTSQTFWLVIIFVLLFVMINFLFFPKIERIKSIRENKINSLIKDAENDNKVAKEMKEILEEDIKKANSLSNDIINKAIKRNKTEIEKTLNSLQIELDRKTERLTNELESEKKKIVENISNHSYELSNIIYNKILSENKKIDSNEFKKFHNS